MPSETPELTIEVGKDVDTNLVFWYDD
jgi:hypothetical protein